MSEFVSGAGAGVISIDSAGGARVAISGLANSTISVSAEASTKLAISGAASSIIEITGAGAIELARPFSPVDGRALEAQPRAGITATTGARLLSSVPKGDGLIARPGHRHISAAPTKRAA